ncbi:P-loop containing nucleoside triphosphate hydrolase protein [Podospora australis]|uniref:P-loop containing nucleoside triphosphate hydrolase protein n=1 Tax=Podospora australis TaxID=1536484 RepID=A0AAN6WL65_9PEZI|nr:P-loop containing nucleoside triphosphate hydrolase protein [Podospora australis]
MHVTRDGHRPLKIDPSSPSEVDIQALEKSTGLDRGQCYGLVAALTREYAMIQGPPGTGKSHVGVQFVRVLLDHKVKASLGPIIVISCYTNHALDQFLKHLKAIGIDKIIRIGGQSRDEELAGNNLRVVSRWETSTRLEGRVLAEKYQERESCFRYSEAIMSTLHSTRKDYLSPNSLLPFLTQYHPRIAAQFKLKDEEGFLLVGKSPIEVWLGGFEYEQGPHNDRASRSIEELRLAAETNVYEIAPRQRRTLAEAWHSEMAEEMSGQLFEFLDQARACQQRIKGVHSDVDRRTLLKADVVGVTTSGLARNIETLRGIRSKVIICEEAGEVKEPDILSALMPGVEHFIQIGDHRQLRPQIQNYLKFSLETRIGQAYQLDRSQFERRAVGEPGLGPLPVAQLNVQRRMRPEISNLIRSVYPGLKDHPSVHNYPDVVGMRHNLFWLDHDQPEESGSDGAPVRSHSNHWEVSMSVALVRHLVRQGEYSPEDIALLTPYTGQLQNLKAALSKDFEVFLSDRDLETLALEGIDMRTSTTANRVEANNNISKVGFLRTENRINVLLSRAKHGMYLIGNTKTYLHIPMWADVFRQLDDVKAVGQAFELSCPRHPDTPIHCENPADFIRLSPKGGCALICDQRLEPCGHRCPAPCHSKALHDAFSCLQPCPRFRDTCQHPCQKLCGETCGPCHVQMRDFLLPCGHKLEQIECYRTLNLATVHCHRPVKKTVRDCEHTVTVDCSTNVADEGFRCPTKCDHTFPCGHGCVGTCGKCRKVGDGGVVSYAHQECRKVCKRAFRTCTHTCSKTCHEGRDCGLCERQCEEARVDLLEFKPYSEIDLSDSPIVVLTCGHFFTGETLDGMIGMNDVYSTGKAGEYYGLQDLSGAFSGRIPACPDCRVPIQQYSTRRYNRVVNKAVIDETVKRFLVHGRQRLQNFQKRFNESEKALVSSRDKLKAAVAVAVPNRYTDLANLHNETGELKKDMTAEHQPTKKLFDAILTFERNRKKGKEKGKGKDTLEQVMGDLSIEGPSELPQPVYNQQVTLEAGLLQLKVKEAILRDKFTLFAQLNNGQILSLAEHSAKQVIPFLVTCKTLVTQSSEAKLPRLAIQATLLFAQMTQLESWFRYKCPSPKDGIEITPAMVSMTGRRNATIQNRQEAAKKLLEEALALCDSFDGGVDFRSEVEQTLRLFEGPRYEEVTPEEIAAIKSAMIRGRGGIATHSGHWYNCENGHPFAIGECGMPMEEARCPDCDARIGGQHHRMVGGVSRATDME